MFQKYHLEILPEERIQSRGQFQCLVFWMKSGESDVIIFTPFQPILYDRRIPVLADLAYLDLSCLIYIVGNIVIIRRNWPRTNRGMKYSQFKKQEVAHSHISFISAVFSLVDQSSDFLLYFS